MTRAAFEGVGVSIFTSEGDLIARCEALATVDAEQFLPYALGRTDDWSLLNTEDRDAPAVVGARSAA